MKSKNKKNITTPNQSISKIELNSVEKENGFYENIVDTVREPLLILDKDLRVVKASKSFLNFFKVSSDETIGKLIYDLGNKQWDIPKLRELLETILPEKTVFDNFEVEHDFSTIGKHFMLLNARQIGTAFGKEKIILLAFEDITNQKKTEETLFEKSRLNSEYLNVLLEHANAPIIVWDSDLRINRFNQEFEKLSGYDSIEVIDKPIEMLFPKDKIDLMIGLLKNNLTDNNSKASEIEILTKEKDIKRVLWNSIRIFDRNDKNIVATITQDFTSRKQIENKLESLETRYRRLFESAKDGILILDAETGKIIDVNPFLIELLDYSKEEFIDKELWQIGFFKDIAANKEKFIKLQEEEYFHYEDLPLETANGRMINVEFVSNVYFVNDRKVVQCNIRDISKKKNAENDLRISENRLRTLIQTIPDIIWLKDLEGKYLLCNQMFERFFGSKEIDIVGKTDYDFVEKEMADFFSEKDRKAMAASKPTSNEELIIFADDGHTAHLETIKAPMYDNYNALIGVLGIGRDITKRKVAEVLLQETEVRYRSFFENSIDGILLTSPDGKTLSANRAACEMFGYTEKELINIGRSGIVDTTDPNLSFLISERAAKGKVRCELTFIRKDGTSFPCEISSAIFKNREGIENTSMVIRDISERREIQQKIKESEKRFRAIFDQAPFAIALMDTQGNILISNIKLSKMIGYSLDELSKMKFSDFSYPEDIEKDMKKFTDLTNGKINSYTLEKRYIHKNGTIVWVNLNVSLLSHDSGTSLEILGMAEDITERKNSENELKDSEEKFRVITENSPDAIFIADDQGKYLYVNSKAVKMLGYSKEEMMRFTIADISPKEKVEEYYLIFKQLLNIGFAKAEIDLLAKNDNLISVDFNAVLLPNGSIYASCRDISERIEIQNKIKFQAELLFNVGQAVIATDLLGNVIYWNHAAENIYGWRIEEAIGKNIIELTPVEQAQKHASEIMKQLVEGKSWSGEFLVKRKDGSSFPSYVTDAPIKDSNGKLIGIIGISSDITERKRSEELLRKLSQAVEQSPVSIMITDTNGNIEYANSKVIESTGYQLSEIIGKNPRMFSSRELPKFEYKKLWDTLLSKNQWSGEFHNKKKNGDLYWELALISPIINNKGEVTHYLAIKEDITEKKLAEDKIILLAHALKSINECVSITDIEDKIIFANESFLKTYGYAEDELLGRNINLVRSEKNSDELTKEILDSTLKGRWHGELWNKRKDGSEFQIFLSTTSIYDKEKKLLGLIGVAKDVTDIKLYQQELIKAKEKAEESDKLKSEFLSQMSHEIRTPINVVLGYADYLSDFFDEPIDSEVVDCFNGINLASNRIIRTIDLILNAAELQTGNYQPNFVTIDLNTDILNKLYQEFLLPAKQRGLELIYTCELIDPKIIADIYSTTQIFANLIDNAIKYTKKGRVVILLTKDIDDKVVVEIKDTGIGIAEEFLHKLFDAFAQEEQGYSRSFEGNGLGLAIVKSYCDFNNARIEVESVKNVGSTFKVIFENKFIVNTN